MVYLQQLEKKHCRTKVQARILRLEGEKSYGFAFEKAPTELGSLQPRLNKNTLVLKRVNETKYLNIYTGQS